MTPLLSVIIPAYGQWPLWPALRTALMAQTLPQGRFEVIIVNNGPPEAVPALDLPPQMRLLHCPVPGSYAARNHGAAQARGDWLVFTDADCLPGPEWLATLANATLANATLADTTLADTTLANATLANAALAKTGGPPSLLAGPVRMIASPSPSRFEVYDLLRGIPQERYVRHGYAATANLSVPRAVFLALGGFDAARLSGGDAAFCRAAGAAGHPVRLVPGAWVGHPCRSDWQALATKARRVKGGQLRGGSWHRRALWLGRSLTPPLRQILRLLGTAAPWGQRWQATRIALCLWGVELAEVARLLAGAAPERR